MDEASKIVLSDEDGNEIMLYILEETKFNGVYYILATDANEDEDGECYILKDTTESETAEAMYEFVTDDDEIDFMFNIFAQLMEDSDTELVK